jgi:hypothetical protein
MYKGMQGKSDPIGRGSEKKNTKDGEGTDDPFIKWESVGVSSGSIPATCLLFCPVLYMTR